MAVVGQLLKVLSVDAAGEVIDTEEINVYWNDDNLGIGTDLPVRKLSVESDEAVSALFCSTNTSNWSFLDVESEDGTKYRSGVFGPDLVGICNGGGSVPHLGITPGGYIKLGGAAPSIKMKRLTGTTAAAEGSNALISHGLTMAKILGWHATVNISGAAFQEEFTAVAGYQYSVNAGGTYMSITNAAGNSANILSMPVTLTIFYEE